MDHNIRKRLMDVNLKVAPVAAVECARVARAKAGKDRGRRETVTRRNGFSRRGLTGRTRGEGSYLLNGDDFVVAEDVFNRI